MLRPVVFLLLLLFLVGFGLSQVPPSILQLCGVETAPNPDGSGEFIGERFNVTTSNADLAVWRFGNTSSSRPPIVYITGFGTTVNAIDLDLMDHLARDQEVVIFDNRGQGLSVDFYPTEPLTIEGMANDTMELIDALDLPTKPIIMGQSMGGFIATTIAALHPDQISKAVVLSGSAGGTSSTVPTAYAINVLTGAVNDTQGSLGFNSNTTRGQAAICNAYLYSDVNMPQSPVNQSTTGRQIGAVINFFINGVDEYLPNTTTPMLLVAGTEDQIVPFDNSRVMASQLPFSWLITLLGGQHVAFLEWYDTFIAVLDEFLSFTV